MIAAPIHLQVDIREYVAGERTVPPAACRTLAPWDDAMVVAAAQGRSRVRRAIAGAAASWVMPDPFSDRRWRQGAGRGGP
jgi:nucleotide-binding universal stress UspA family protein